MSNVDRQLVQNLTAIRERIARSCERARRSPASVTLVAVTKYGDAALARKLVEAGCLDLAESRPQQLWQKAAALDDLTVRWHMVGHLQRNKVNRTLPLLHLLHSGDSERLLVEVDAVAREQGRRVPVLLEVNIANEPLKHGFASHELEAAFDRIVALQHIELRGLMAMAAFDRQGESARVDFAALRELRDRLQQRAPAGVSLAELSMGMSRDFEAAIAEGATLVRIGSALFEGLPDA